MFKGVCCKREYCNSGVIRKTRAGMSQRRKGKVLGREKQHMRARLCGVSKDQHLIQHVPNTEHMVQCLCVYLPGKLLNF